MSKRPDPQKVLEWSRRPEASPFHKKIGTAYFAMARELERWRKAARVATEAYPEGTQCKEMVHNGKWVDASHAYIVAFEEFERLDGLVELLAEKDE